MQTIKTKLASSLNQLLDEKQAALLLGTATPSLRKSRCTGVLFGIPAPQYLKLGRSIRYKTSVLNSWLDALEKHSVNPAQEA
ncbi:hypothetical protein [Thalassotalea sp. SU-HH00458]|uniref:hypothetical protein n=1 Tax=Thalassotalea sp. SU-HH00458 TaxID=3127657 RepID=UPI003106150E